MTRQTAKPAMKERILRRMGLTTQARLERESAARARWHGLVRDVFARYYLKFREPFYTCLPPLPHRYTAEWEAQMKNDLQRFVEMDLQPVAELLEVCGFGEERWDQVCAHGFAPLEAFISALLSDPEQALSAATGAPSADARDEALAASRDEIRKLRIAGRRALQQLEEYREQIARMERSEASVSEVPEEEDEGGPDGGLDFPPPPDEVDAERVTALQKELAERDERIAALQQELLAATDTEGFVAQTPGADVPEPGAAGEQPDLAPATEAQRVLLEERDATIQDLQDQLRQLRQELEDAPASAEDSLMVDDDLARQNAQLRGELRAKDQTIETLTQQTSELQDAMDSTRGQLMDQVKKLGDLAAGDIQLKPAEELESMGADELLSYAQEVAGDLDVKKQVLNEGIEGVEGLRANYDESRRFYETQQRKFQAQLEEMGAQLERYQLEQQNEDGTVENASELIATQRHQLALLKSRITELSSTNKNLSVNNNKMYKDLEGAVKKLIPLRRQIEELENLRETLCRYIREKHDRTFTIRRLK